MFIPKTQITPRLLGALKKHKAYLIDQIEAIDVLLGESEVKATSLKEKLSEVFEEQVFETLTSMGMAYGIGVTFALSPVYPNEDFKKLERKVNKTLIKLRREGKIETTGSKAGKFRYAPIKLPTL